MNSSFQFLKVVGSLLFTTSLFSQIQLTRNDFPHAGDTVRYSRLASSTLDFQATGDAFVWDFTSLVAETQYRKDFNSIGISPVQLTFGQFAPEPYRATFYNLNNEIPVDQLNQFLPVVLSDLNAYFKVVNDSMTQVGYSIKVNGADVGFQSDTIETLYRFPLSMDSAYHSVGYTKVDLNPLADFILKQHRERFSVVDGFGTLQTPYTTKEVIRIKHTIYELDSVYQTFFGTGQWFATPMTTTYQYEWWANGEKDALLRVVQTENQGTLQTRTIEFKDVYLGLDAGIEENAWNVSVYPNPTEDKVIISSENYLDRIIFKDLNGKEILSVSPQGTQAEIAIASFPSGIYLMELKSNNATQVRKISKI